MGRNVSFNTSYDGRVTQLLMTPGSQLTKYTHQTWSGNTTKGTHWRAIKVHCQETKANASLLVASPQHHVVSSPLKHLHRLGLAHRPSPHPPQGQSPCQV